MNERDPVHGGPAAAGPGGEPPRDAASGAADTLARDSGLAVLTRLSAAIRVGRSYQPDNVVFVQQIESFLQVLKPLLEQSGEVVLVSLDNDLYLNGTRIPVKAANVRFHRGILEEFQRRQIAGFRVAAGVTIDEVKTFFRLFLQPDVYQGSDLLTQCLAQGTDHFLPAVHASTCAPDAAFELSAAAMARRAPAPGDVGLDDSGPVDRGFDPAAFPGDRDLGTPGSGSPRGAVRKKYTAAVAGARSLLMTTSLQGGMELRHAKRVVQPLVDGAFGSEPVVVGLSSLTHHDEYTYAHAVNVTLVAVTMGHFLEMDRRALADLGVAALLHDCGKSAVAKEIHNTMDAFSPEEELAAERHPVEGVKLLARSTMLNQTTLRCMKVSLEHHFGPEGSGFPALGGNWQTSMLSRIVAVADCFVSLQMHRSVRGAYVTPFEALGMMLGPLKARFHPAMLWALVQTVGFYPPGQLVELDDGVTAVVLAPNAGDLARPHLRPVFAPDGRRYAAGEAGDLKPLPGDRSVKRALRGAEYPGDPSQAA
jgi:HD-GYP domain-containing protein (c-di-GMP phosphodiesterase class II)